MRGLSILSLFHYEFNKFNNTRARMTMLDSIYHMTNTLKSDFWRKNVIILSLFMQHCYIILSLFMQHCYIILSLFMQHCYGSHNVSRINFIAWRYFTPRRDVI